jgi:L-lactate dehydrogenase complex protein LldG
MSSRDAILAALRRGAGAPAPLPPYPEPTRYADPVEKFLETARAVGATAVRVAVPAELDAELRKLAAWAGARKTVSLVAGAGASTVDVAAARRPQDLEGVEVAVVPGEVGVAENGAVWVPGANLGPQRAIFVITEHLVLVVRAQDVVSSMQEAYARITIQRPGFGLFISGPSKTADIEQSLVVGAHGARSCAVLVVG